MAAFYINHDSLVSCVETFNNNNENNIRRIVRPRIMDYLDDGHGDVSPLVLIGFFGSDVVYRVTNTLGLEREGNLDGDFEVHWPALFPDIIIPICGPLQLDVTFRCIEDHLNSSNINNNDNNDDDDDDDDDTLEESSDESYTDSDNVQGPLSSLSSSSSSSLMLLELDDVRWWE
ncbi:unnamed protein product [Rotaria magnacalcarata]|uniref:Uncharacterized protein n=1 Tax=Rotaria magnacalcarata TaxID=392030 RepID=A0A815UKC8_9BILA|nr:unnamed protein product [Rotaria magnacalcarata]CAF1520350.1 unnamed protein product [Rotaria magnacalcarata]CAF2046882.1 unnamed protein product [Rotaria magnacalcarata]CAF3756264.1 unnamed protein product [Rotaria magnacalcarata]CAF3819126.1 unnamed protein product [Rotaria magnacalcarata]